MRLYRQTVEDFGLFAGLELAQDQMDGLRQAAGAMSAKMRAVRILASSNVSKKDLQQRLVQKGETPQQAEAAVRWMEDLQLVDDAETARQIVSRCVTRGYGRSRAKQALYEKKIPKEYWEAALAEYPQQTDKIMEFLRSRLQDGADERQLRRVTDALLRRGHSYGEIRKALQQLQLDADDFPEE